MSSPINRVRGRSPGLPHRALQLGGGGGAPARRSAGEGQWGRCQAADAGNRNGPGGEDNGDWTMELSMGIPRIMENPMKMDDN